MAFSCGSPASLLAACSKGANKQRRRHDIKWGEWKAGRGVSSHIDPRSHLVGPHRQTATAPLRLRAPCKGKTQVDETTATANEDYYYNYSPLLYYRVRITAFFQSNVEVTRNNNIQHGPASGPLSGPTRSHRTGSGRVLGIGTIHRPGHKVCPRANAARPPTSAGRRQSLSANGNFTFFYSPNHIAAQKRKILSFFFSFTKISHFANCSSWKVQNGKKCK